MTWPAYLIGAHAAWYRCSTCLLVLTTDEAVATWRAQPIDIGHPGWVLRPSGASARTQCPC